MLQMSNGSQILPRIEFKVLVPLFFLIIIAVIVFLTITMRALEADKFVKLSKDSKLK